MEVYGGGLACPGLAGGIAALAMHNLWPNYGQLSAASELILIKLPRAHSPLH